MGTNFKVCEIGLLTLFVALAFQNELKYRHADSKRFSGDYFSTLCVNFLWYGSVTPESMRGNGVRPLVDYQFSYVSLAAPLLDTTVIGAEQWGLQAMLCSPFSSFILRIRTPLVQ